MEVSMSQKNSLEDGRIRQTIQNGQAVLGIELGSTRIKAVLIDETYAPIASGGYNWENRLEAGVWTYHLDDVWAGLQSSFQELFQDVMDKYNVPLIRVGAIGVSAMMHGYLVFNHEEEQLVPFRTWRNTTTEQAAALLTDSFQYNVPQRWSISHLYQAILNGEKHTGDIAFMTTLSGYVHWKLTGQKVLGVGDASGMFPIDSTTKDYHSHMVEQFDSLLRDRNLKFKLADIMPKVLCAGEPAGCLTEEGAKLLDPSGQLQTGIPMCAPEGDAGTGMVATNSVVERTGNVSAGTSIFAMVVLEKELSKLHIEIDMVTTPAGKPVAMVHCNNCTSDLDAWVKLFGELYSSMGFQVKKSELYDMLYEKALEGEPDCGGLLSYNSVSGEPLTGFDQGRPLLTRTPDSQFTLGNFMRALLFSTVSTLKIGMDILEEEQVKLEQILGHGGLFKTPVVGQRMIAAALGVPIAVMESAGEGGAWGIALLAAYHINPADDKSLEAFLANMVFCGNKGTVLTPDAADQKGFAVFLERYRRGLEIQKAAVTYLN